MECKNAKAGGINRKLIIFICLLIIGSILALTYAALTGNTNQVFTDVIREFTSEQGSNKSAERNMFYIFSLVGAAVYTFAYFICKSTPQNEAKERINKSVYALTALLVIIGVNYIIYHKKSPILLAALVITIIAIIIDKTNAVETLALYILSVYAACGLYRLYVFCGGKKGISTIYLTLFGVVVSLVFLLINKKIDILLKGILFSQVLIPLSLLIYVTSNYLTSNGEYYSILVPKRAQFLIFLLIFVFIVEVLYRIKGWSNYNSLQDVVCYGSTVSIMAFNRFSGSGSIAMFDFHHTYENVIGFSQIFQLGQKPFSDYIPVSGMYSVLHGFIFWLFGHGLETYYFLSTNIFFLLIILGIVFLLRRQLSAEYVLLISGLLYVEDYNRVALIVPGMLLLTWPALIENKNLWLKVWMLSSYVHGLYYPVFGAAVCIAFLPLGIWQIYTYAKSGDLAEDVKTAKFWIWWLVCVLPILAGTTLLLGTLKHMLAMGNQTIFADGLARFAQIIPSDFLGYIPNTSIRMVVYLLLSYMTLISVIWASVALFLRCGEVSIKDKKLSINNPVAGMISISLMILFLVAFSYTVVRFDHLKFYSRNTGIIAAAFVLLIMVVDRYIPKNDRVTIWILVFAVSLLSVASFEGIWKIDTEEKLEACYQVPEGYIRINDVSVHLGDCFIDPGSYEYILHFKEIADKCDKDKQYLGLFESFGLFYFCDIKGESVMEIANTIRGYGAAKETIDLLKEKKPIVGRNVYPHNNYYLYHWLVTSGNYIWNNDMRLFLPNDGIYSKEEVLDINRPIDISWGDLDLERTSGSWGSSMDSLENIFTELDVNYSVNQDDKRFDISFENGFDGDDADFLYLDFGDLKDDQYRYTVLYSDGEYHPENDGILKYFYKRDYNPDINVVVSWYDNYNRHQSIKCNIDEGQLLIPVGSRPGWLLNNHQDICVEIEGQSEKADSLHLQNVRMLKIREVQ